MTTDLEYKMIMALSAADLGSPICEQAAAICAEIADQHCAELHVTMTAPVITVGQDDASHPAGARLPRFLTTTSGHRPGGAKSNVPSHLM
jgi:hypothetical protein